MPPTPAPTSALTSTLTSTLTPTAAPLDGRLPRTVLAAPADTPARLAAALGNAGLGPVVVLAGGDDAVPDALRARLVQLLARGLVRALHESSAHLGVQAMCVVRACGDGLPRLLAQVVADGGHAVRLVGVAPEGRVAVPGSPADAPSQSQPQSQPQPQPRPDRSPPVPGLAQLLVLPGADWGDESGRKADVVQQLVTGPGPRRAMLLLIGGGPGAMAEVRDAVRRGWPVLLVAGSGGCADALARQIEADEADGDDPVVADILADGRLCPITLGDKAAGAVDALAHLVQRECAGDSVLRLAWQRYATLSTAAKGQQDDFAWVQASILTLGVVVVAMSVGYTVLKDRPDWVGVCASSLRYALIVAPISVSALIAVGNLFSPGKRWVLLRSAAEALKREIYRYRVRPPRSAPGGADPAAPQRLPEGTREKRLVEAMDTITRRLALTAVNTMGLPPYTGPIPPGSLAKGDDGLSPLGTADYVRLRVLDQLTFYRNKTADLSWKAGAWQMGAIVVGALGTLLAALDEPWVAWVALTSALASAATGYLGYKQFESTLTVYNQTATDLENIQSWWTALLPAERADPANVDKLVTTTEQVLADEQNKWAQNMTNALAALRNTQERKGDTAGGEGDGAADGGKGTDERARAAAAAAAGAGAVADAAAVAAGAVAVDAAAVVAGAGAAAAAAAAVADQAAASVASVASAGTASLAGADAGEAAALGKAGGESVGAPVGAPVAAADDPAADGDAAERSGGIDAPDGEAAPNPSAGGGTPLPPAPAKPGP